jgi:hypothetical protein
MVTIVSTHAKRIPRLAAGEILEPLAAGVPPRVMRERLNFTSITDAQFPASLSRNIPSRWPPKCPPSNYLPAVLFFISMPPSGVFRSAIYSHTLAIGAVGRECWLAVHFRTDFSTNEHAANMKLIVPRI